LPQNRTEGLFRSDLPNEMNSSNGLMWKLLPVCLLVSCAMNDQQQTASNANQTSQARIVRQVDLPVESFTQTGIDQPAKKTFRSTGIQGWLDETGAWLISG
jgi:hypothetical protein